MTFNYHGVSWLVGKIGAMPYGHSQRFERHVWWEIVPYVASCRMSMVRAMSSANALRGRVGRGLKQCSNYSNTFGMPFGRSGP